MTGRPTETLFTDGHNDEVTMGFMARILDCLMD